MSENYKMIEDVDSFNEVFERVKKAQEQFSKYSQ